MRDDIVREIENLLKLEYDTDYEFKEISGLTFAFKREIIKFQGRISSAEISPAGIIYEENGEYYFAPLDEAYNIHEIVREFVKKCV